MTMVANAEKVGVPATPELTAQMEVALLARALWRVGYCDGIAGHITYDQGDGTWLANPFGLSWEELTASDIVRIDGSGHVVEGRLGVTPAIELHLAIHRLRPHDQVVVHNHPRFATIWSAAKRFPPAYDQWSCVAVEAETQIIPEYTGDVTQVEAARASATALGQANFALIANHGILVVANSITHAYHRAHALEHRCEQAWRVQAMGGASPMPRVWEDKLGSVLNQLGGPHVWNAAVRKEIREDPSVLD